MDNITNQAAVTCPGCGTANKADARFCVACGTALAAPEQPAFAPIAEPEISPVVEPIAEAPAFAPAVEEKPEPKAAPQAVPTVVYEEPESVFAQGLPEWSIEPPQVMVRRNRKA